MRFKRRSNPLLKRKLRRGFPVATVAFYGPDDRRASKAAVGIVTAADAEPIMKRWFSEDADVRTDRSIRAQILQFIHTYGAAENVIISDDIIRCPHEGGIDFPGWRSLPAVPVLGAPRAQGRRNGAVTGAGPIAGANGGHPDHSHPMPKRSAGLLLFRNPIQLEVFLVHPGGPFWAKKDDGAWSIPKGEYAEPEDPLQAAKREFHEETGFAIDGDFLPLGEIKQRGGKTVMAWAIEKEINATQVKSNTFSIEWPRKSGKTQQFPEVDRAAWFPISTARRKLLQGQAAFLDRLANARPLLPTASPDPETSSTRFPSSKSPLKRRT